MIFIQKKLNVRLILNMSFEIIIQNIIRFAILFKFE
jgi:hypothetical protein